MIDDKSPKGSWKAHLDLMRVDGKIVIVLDFPPSSFSGHNNGGWQAKSNLVKTYRANAKLLTEQVKQNLPDTGDIPIKIDFFRPDRRGDRVNFPNRMKPYIDGIADGLGVNDARFLPSYHFHDDFGGGKVVVTI